MHTPLHSSGSGWARTRRNWARAVAALALPLLGMASAQAQSVANYTFAASTGTFTPLSGGTVATASSTDDGVTAVQPIGFTFIYNGLAYTTFSASTNGFLGLGGQVTSNAGNNLSTGTGVRPFIAPLWDDLQLTTASDISYATTGTAGSRVLTVEWLNEKWNYQATAAVVSFQAKLYEADGHIEFVYRSEAGTYNAGSTGGASVGITGVGTGAGNFLSLSDLVAAPTASSTTETTAITTKPATGQVYTFTPAGGAVLAPSGLTFSAITTTGGTVTFTDNSTNEYGFAVTITPTAGGTATTTIVPSTTTAGTSTTYSTTFSNLSANTGYTVQVVALGQGQGSPAGTGTFTTQAGATLSGTYYVGTSTSPQPTRTYATLTAAASAYNTATLAGAVTFVLLDNSYSTAETFPIVFGNNTTASATNTLTIRPNTGVTSTITSAASALAFLNARYIILDGSNTAGSATRNLTVTSTSATAGAYGIGLISTASTGPGNQFVTVRNANVVSGSNTVGTFGIYVGNGPDNDNVTLTNNSVQGSYYGIYAFGSATASAGGMDNFVVSNNVVGPATAASATNIGLWGIFVSNAVAPAITSNEVQNVRGANTNNLYGIYLVDTKNAVVSRNSVHNLAYTGTSTYKVWAINSQQANLSTAANPSAVRLDNNLLYNINSTTASATWNTVGINLGGGYGDQIVYNTVYLSGQLSAAGGTAGSAAFANGNPSVSTTATNIDVRNNIFSIIGGTGGSATTPLYAHYEQGTAITGSTLNYNDLYVTTGATGAARIGRLNGTDATTLAAWQTATGQEANSLSVDPQFVQTTTVPFDLTPTNSALNNVGTPITGVTVDFTGATRSTTPDIGAYEFTVVAVDIAAAGLVAPAVAGTSGACYGSAEAVTVSIRNAGSAALNFATTPATITVVVTGPTGVATQTLTYTLNTGTLAGGATLNVPLTGAGTTVNLSTVGSYSFAITASVAGDANAANNTLTPNPTITVSAPVAGTLSAASPSLCNSGTTALNLAGALNGAIQLQSSTSATGTFTNIAGATSATYTTPVINSTTYYRAQVTCGTTVVTSNVVAVTVSNPQLTGTPSPVSVCAGSTATLTANAPAGTTVQFFTAATGGTPLAGATTTGTATSVVTSAITTNTTFYAEASTGSTEVGGRQAPTVTTGFLGIDTGLVFSTTTGLTIQSAVIYPVGTGTITFALRDNTGAEIAATPALSVTGSGATTPVTVQLNLTVPSAGTGYQLVVKAYTGITDLLRENPLPAGASFPITSPSGNFSITGGLNVTPLAAYYYFYNITLSTACVGATRTPIQVTAIPLPATPTVTVAYPSRGTAVFTSSAAPAGATYQWYQGSNPITGATSQTYTAVGTTTPTGYSVRFITTTGGCQSALSTPITVTATAQPLAGSALYLFPNPTATGMLTLKLQGYSKAVQLNVYDALGRVVLTQQVAAGQTETQLNLSAAAAGVYTLRVTTEGGTDLRRIVRE
ncbi:beta strand repeat-containing protein [Hymenobacter properus]|uniref:T9SS type A sorting domain-containing protein n=1 Tax=Hymenobacter properus TaxID=2791026 RepID=A0A931BI95_9BACT|nr:T9SS type A sorting domain-containing protein [Hymenobacter properus]MBF9142772.1 T9SS type A sorting domain-containing protein [Hymenobacter properus]MBR7721580.1 T9SS type A sorting domain-containing protein [Microvirga sp. SRT04]